MAPSELLQTEDITLTFETWTFDPSVLIPDAEIEGLFRFPEEVEALFDDFECGIYGITAEVFENAEIDGKEAYVSTGIKPIAVIEDFFPDEDNSGREEEPLCLIEGGKVMFRGDIFFIQNPADAIVRF